MKRPFPRTRVRGLRRGDLVEVRGPAEILTTLDETGSLAGVPFMPEMLRHLGNRHAVEARVERACDTAHQTGVRRLPDTVLLEDLRCDGSGHGGCQAACRLYWNEAWLKRVSPSEPPSTSLRTGDPAYEELARVAAANARSAEGDSPCYRCQATTFFEASTPLGFWDARSLLNEVRCGNVSVTRFVEVMSRALSEEIRLRLRRGRSTSAKPPAAEAERPLDLRPGEVVQIRPYVEIAQTLDSAGKSRGLFFDRNEMTPYCGGTYPVAARVQRFVDEQTGRMVELSSDCLILEGVVCSGDRSYGRWFCRRCVYPWWRERWLRKPTTDASHDGR
jgi:hypothetical protein